MLKSSRYLLLCYLIFLCTEITFAQVDQFNPKGEIQIDAELQHAFELDAARLALRLSENLKQADIELQPQQWQRYYDLLVSIYQQDELSRELVNCGIHTTANPSVDYIELIYRRDVNWAKPLQEGVTSTNESTINKLMEERNLIIQSNEAADYKHDALVMRAARPLNMSALINELQGVEGISSINLLRPAATDVVTDIQMERVKGGWKVVYLLQYEDNKNHSWSYYMPKTGRVKFISEKGDPLPEGWACH
ncbi:MAG: hypothetical protein AAGI23_05555 [Bacteroidota bacterium]